ncbi:hypothetical protein N9N67_05925 [Bacteriovoracaceae bacterium]|nr:hypothetical protein [Bacteriovoracaceae bacterium]
MGIDRQEFKQQLITDFIKAKKPSDFLQKAFALNKLRNQHYSYELCAQQSQLSSKVHAHQLINGKRKLSFESCQKLAKGLKLSKDIENGLLSLSSYYQTKDEKEAKKLKSIYKKLKAQLITKNVKSINHSCWPLLFCSLGKIDEGRSLSEILQISGLSKPVAIKELSEMIKAGIVSYAKDLDLYQPLVEHLDLKGLSGDNIFQELYLKNLDLTKNKSKKYFNSEHHAFFNSYFSIPKNKMPELTKKFQDILSDFTAESIDEEAKDIAILVGGLFISGTD